MKLQDLDRAALPTDFFDTTLDHSDFNFSGWDSTVLKSRWQLEEKLSPPQKLHLIAQLKLLFELHLKLAEISSRHSDDKSRRFCSGGFVGLAATSAALFVEAKAFFRGFVRC